MRGGKTRRRSWRDRGGTDSGELARDPLARDTPLVIDHPTSNIQLKSKFGIYQYESGNKRAYCVPFNFRVCVISGHQFRFTGSWSGERRGERIGLDVDSFRGVDEFARRRRRSLTSDVRTQHDARKKFPPFDSDKDLTHAVLTAHEDGSSERPQSASRGGLTSLPSTTTITPPTVHRLPFTSDVSADALARTPTCRSPVESIPASSPADGFAARAGRELQASWTGPLRVTSRKPSRLVAQRW
ncbi:hypothetical protein AB1N83_013657 [Pleurotus pulmonarius]